MALMLDTVAIALGVLGGGVTPSGRAHKRLKVTRAFWSACCGISAMCLERVLGDVLCRERVVSAHLDGAFVTTAPPMRWSMWKMSTLQGYACARPNTSVPWSQERCGRLYLDCKPHAQRCKASSRCMLEPTREMTRKPYTEKTKPDNHYHTERNENQKFQEHRDTPNAGKMSKT
eukprot:3251225-Amphidinium_carterae.1